ncbi:MAG: hypothetical protein ABIJ96_05715 [Elusimicrobiota bacterium]
MRCAGALLAAALCPAGVWAALPDWTTAPYAGLADPGGYLVGVGVAEVRPDSATTRALSFAQAAQSLVVSLQARVAEQNLEYETLQHRFAEKTVKGYTVRTIEGFCTTKFMLRDYGSEVSADDEGMVERTMIAEFPPVSTASVRVLYQEHLDAATTAYWTRLILPRGGAADLSATEFQSWDNREPTSVRDYATAYSGGLQDVSLQVRIGGEEDGMTWEEDSIGEEQRVGVLKSSAAASRFLFNPARSLWLPLVEDADDSWKPAAVPGSLPVERGEDDDWSDLDPF